MYFKFFKLHSRDKISVVQAADDLFRASLNPYCTSAFGTAYSRKVKNRLY